MDWLKDIVKTLVDEDKVEDTMKTFNEAFTKNAVPKDKYNQMSEKAQSFESQFNESQKTIESMTEKVKGNEELQKSFDELKATHDSTVGELNRKLSTQNVRSLIEKGLRGAKALEENIDLLMNDFKIDEMKVSEDGKSIIGFDDYLKSVQEKRPSSFPKVEDGSNGGENQNNPDAGDGDTAAFRKAMGLPPEK